MEAINNRVGNFTSSQIHKLMGAPKPKATYIAEKNYERKLQRSLNGEAFSYPTSWGNCVEQYVHNLLPFDYKLASKEVIIHPTIDYWRGSPDLLKGDTVSDIKCPYTLKSFCEMIEICEQGLQVFKNELPEYYWQLISNAVLTNKSSIELIIFCPYKSELMAIREIADNYNGDDPFQFKWIYDCQDKKLPWIVEGGFYKNINKFTFDIPPGEKEILTAKIIEAGKLLNGGL